MTFRVSMYLCIEGCHITKMCHVSCIQVWNDVGILVSVFTESDDCKRP